jgi:hypothetical protein
LDDQEAAGMLLQELASRVHGAVSTTLPEAPPSPNTIFKHNEKGETLRQQFYARLGMCPSVPTAIKDAEPTPIEVCTCSKPVQ